MPKPLIFKRLFRVENLSHRQRDQRVTLPVADSGSGGRVQRVKDKTYNSGVFVLFDFTTSNLAELGSAEVIVVGAGAVGLTLAVDLAQADCRVLLLEAGPTTVTKESQAFFENCTFTGFPLQGSQLGRFRALGGTTNFWGGQLVAMEPLIFQHRPWVADAEWPIAERELFPAYERAFKLLGMSKQISDDGEIWRRLAIQPPPNTMELELFFTRWTPITNFARLFHKQILNHPNLNVLVNAPITALFIDEGRVRGVKVKAIGRREAMFEATAVVLSNGTIEIARLLQCPLADGTSTPWNSNPWLGKGFVDHVDCYAGEVITIDRARFHDIFDNAYLEGIKYSPKIKLTESAQIQNQTMSIAGHFIFNSSLSEHVELAKNFFSSLLRGKFTTEIFSNPSEIFTLFRVAIPMIHRYFRHRRMYNFLDRGIQLRLTCEQKPLASSVIRLNDCRDSLGVPIVHVEWQVSGEELETMACFAELLGDFLDANRLAKVQLDPRLADRDPAFLKTVDDSNHHMGGARMAKSAADGVVDRDLRVFGTPNLYVAGAAVFPTTGFSNPTFTAIALGLRLSMKIRQQLQ